ncbi:hypothetical protein OESDEN_17547 [Oesophagostomum dentatum]|uniref:Uncharacterized protein n=1 Tax=Oesophagostomum dentatum TaxID=61180 RepID=A0A0B1SBS9_OESDE|nr:hypothetical protein OESDEN_17547 [Oesophagostomum dentatum]
MDKPCPFWPDDRQCGSKQCGIAFCDDEVPLGLRRPSVATVRLFDNDYPFSNRTAETKRRFRNHTTRGIVSTSTLQEECRSAGQESNDFDPMDRSLDEGYREQLKDMDIHDDQENKFCEVDG